jgi:hypothetical protein
MRKFFVAFLVFLTISGMANASIVTAAEDLWRIVTVALGFGSREYKKHQASEKQEKIEAAKAEASDLARLVQPCILENSKQTNISEKPTDRDSLNRGRGQPFSNSDMRFACVMEYLECVDDRKNHIDKEKYCQDKVNKMRISRK